MTATPTAAVCKCGHPRDGHEHDGEIWAACCEPLTIDGQTATCWCSEFEAYTLSAKGWLLQHGDAFIHLPLVRRFVPQRFQHWLCNAHDRCFYP